MMDRKMSRMIKARYLISIGYTAMKFFPIQNKKYTNIVKLNTNFLKIIGKNARKFLSVYAMKKCVMERTCFSVLR